MQNDDEPKLTYSPSDNLKLDNWKYDGEGVQSSGLTQDVCFSAITLLIFVRFEDISSALSIQQHGLRCPLIIEQRETTYFLLPL